MFADGPSFRRESIPIPKRSLRSRRWRSIEGANLDLALSGLPKQGTRRADGKRLRRARTRAVLRYSCSSRSPLVSGPLFGLTSLRTFGLRRQIKAGDTLGENRRE